MSYSSITKHIIDNIVAYIPSIEIVSNYKWYEKFDGFDYTKPFTQSEKVLKVYKSKSPIRWSDGKTTYANYTIGNAVAIDEFFVNATARDAYGTIVIDNKYMLFNTYDTPAPSTPRHYIHIVDICVLELDGQVEYVSLSLNTRNLKYVMTKHIRRSLPQGILDNYDGESLFKLFGGKRAFRYEEKTDTISLRTKIGVYDFIPDRYKQSEESKNDLSYPRLQLAESRVEKLQKVLEHEY